MTCLADRVLQALVDGAVADPGARMHLEDCAACRERRDLLVRETALVAHLLRDGPMPALSRRAARPAWWIPLGAAAAAVALATVVLLPWDVGDDPSPPAAETRAAAFEDVARALFAADDTEWMPEPVQRSGFQPLQAALRGEWPCAGRDPWTDQGCD
jgi:hypothetical protein